MAGAIHAQQPLTLMEQNQEPCMQNRCPNCYAEIYALNVWDFSHGHCPCHRCGKTSKPMGEDEYRGSISRLRDELYDKKQLD